MLEEGARRLDHEQRRAALQTVHNQESKRRANLETPRGEGSSDSRRTTQTESHAVRVVRHLKTRLHNSSSTLGLALQFTVQRVDENVPIRRAS